jgi:hypothetical protein
MLGKPEEQEHAQERTGGMKIEVKHRFTGDVICSGEFASIKECVEKHVARGADLRGAYLKGADLRGAYLRGADLRGADLSDAYLRGANLRGAYLSGAYLSDAYLRGAYLRGAYLSDAYLRGADLRGAYLRGADLRGADLRGANLSDADLSGANLSDEKLTKEPLMITGLKYFVLISVEKIHIGCEVHKAEEWEKFKDSTIAAMDFGALKWWAVYKPIIMALHKEHAK